MAKSLRKYIRVYYHLLKINLISQLEYRSNFFVGFIVESGFLFTKIMYLVVLYNVDVTINGYSPDHMMLYVGTFSIVTAFYTGFIMINFYEIPGHVKNGTLDMFITKPISTQFLVTLRKSNFALAMSNLIGGIVMVIIACSRIGGEIDAYNLIGYLALIICGIVMSYALFLLPQLLSFWVVETKALIGLADRAWDFNTMPMVIFPKWFQRIGTFILPIFAISNFPPMLLAGHMKIYLIIWAVASPFLFLYLVSKLWNIAIRSYTSASS
ncbi:ABC-2 family transporter protein [Paenibacillus hexagrammi]|uniref:ABC-2 family transporter protein n=1 Tax=Paenibacillus hexagrammi TaxID=2908839 RepID=A0ABY3SNF3_9BACL|nr:ABC-2 family transporter protein [Paenibacillus sp. YPD9-1]UJF35527.1 ABC-2 family transporter protein [Paenibacillus sp. YPD9-1]